MFSVSRAQRLCLSLAAGFAVVLMASPAVHADEAALAALPAPGPSWDATSGYGAVEANRATNPLAPALPVSTSMVSRDVRWAPASAAVVAAANAWDLMSGYGAVEANRAEASAALAPAPSRPGPSLSDVSASTQTPTVFTVTGQDFTPGGRVYLAIYDQMGARLYETRWITASLASTVMLHQPGDGMLGRSPMALPGGTLHEHFGQLCGATAMMRGLDERTAAWSNWLAVEPACLSGALAAQPADASIAAVAPIAPVSAPGPSVDANRAATAVYEALAYGSSWDAPTSDAVTRERAARVALRSSDLGSLQEEALAALVAASTAWDGTSGDSTVAASRSAASARVGSPDATDLAAADCLPGAVIQTLSVPADGALVHSAVLDSGQPYQLRASGSLTTNPGMKLGVLSVDAWYRYFLGCP